MAAVSVTSRVASAQRLNDTFKIGNQSGHRPGQVVERSCMDTHAFIGVMIAVVQLSEAMQDVFLKNLEVMKKLLGVLLLRHRLLPCLFEHRAHR